MNAEFQRIYDMRILITTWTHEELKAWAEERAAGVQYITPYGVVRCPPRWWEKK